MPLMSCAVPDMPPPGVCLLLLLCAAAPSDPQSSGGPYSYVPITTFANNMGQLAAVRCLGSDEHGSLCMYNGYDKPMPSAAGRRRLAGAHAAAAAAALAAAAWLVL